MLQRGESVGSCVKKFDCEGRENAGGERRHRLKGKYFISPDFLDIRKM